MFSEDGRASIMEQILARARSDSRIVAGAAVGSTAEGQDRWSDLDLTFGFAEGSSLEAILVDWTEYMKREFGALHLFDLPHFSTHYRVFLLRGNLQVDLSFTPAGEFGALGPRFKLLFGRPVDRKWNQPPSPSDLFGHAVHHLVRARICTERGRLWQAEYWVSLARDQALALACRRLGLEAGSARGFDKLPPDVKAQFKGTFADPLDRQRLLAALGGTVDALLMNAQDVPEQAGILKERLIALKSDPLD